MRNRTTLLMLCAFLILAKSTNAHEGHQPLPTEGVQVDLASGRVVLSRAARDALDVQTVDVQSYEFANEVSAYTTVVTPWTQHAFVTSKLPGRIVQLNVRAGDTISAGDVLAEVESVDLLTLRLDYQKAQTEIELSAKILESVEPSAEAGAVPAQRLFEVQTTHRRNQNALQVLRAKAASLQIAESLLADGGNNDAASAPLRLLLKSPIGGVVLHADLALGKFAEPNEHLFEIVDASRSWVKIGVLEHDLHRVRQGDVTNLSFVGFPGQALTATIDKVDMLLDQQTHQGTAWAEVDNTTLDLRILPGMTGQAAIAIAPQGASTAVPVQAVFSDGAERYVLVEEAATNEGSEYRKVPVVVGAKRKGHAAIRAGKLLPGDRVVTRGGHELSTLFFQGVLRVSKETAESIALQVDSVSLRPIDDILQIDASVHIPPQQRTNASSQLAGTIQQILVDRGESVQAGDVLAEVASLEVHDLQLALLQAELEGELWRDTLERQRGAGYAIMRRTVLETESRVATLDAQSSSVREKLLMLGLTLEQIDNIVQSGEILTAIPVRAPIGGAVVQFDRVLGQVVRADEPLFEIHDLSHPWVQAYVSERESTSLRIGQTARLRFVAFPDHYVEGTVSRVGPVIGGDTRTQEVWIEIRQKPEFTLQHGMLAQATVTLQQSSPTVAVPSEAVVREGLNSFVFVRQPDDTYDRRQVATGRSDDRFVSIVSGLMEGELVVTRGVSELQTAFASVR